MDKFILVNGTIIAIDTIKTIQENHSTLDERDGLEAELIISFKDGTTLAFTSDHEGVMEDFSRLEQQLIGDK